MGIPVIVDVEELEKLQNGIGSAVEELEKLQNGIERFKRNKRADITTKDSTRTHEKYDFTEREKRIYEYIKNNPGSTKQDVVYNFEGTYSRSPIFKTIVQLEKGEIIIVRHDEHNNHVRRLLINYENILVSLAERLDSFKQRYFELIDKAMTIDIQRQNMSGGGEWRPFDSPMFELVGTLLFPYKQFITKYNLDDLFLSHDLKLDDETLHRKFTIVFDTMQEIHVKLYQMMSDKRWIDNGEELKERLLSNFTLEKSNYEELGDVLKIFEKYGLRQSAEAVFDSLFGNRDWLKLIPKFSRSAWRDTVVEIALHSLSSP
jgi:hypothetical protein